MMRALTTRLTVTEDGRIEGIAPADLLPGEHEAVLVIDERVQPMKRLRVEDLPRHDLGWDSSVSLRREDMYGDDGR
jgi:hypothetical protein